MSFILIDHLLQLDESQVVADKVFKPEDPLFADHFPGGGIVPGTLLLEAMAQSCGWWISWKSQATRKSVLLLAEAVQFRNFIRPGQVIRIVGRVLQFGEKRARFEVEAWVEEKRAAKAELSFAIFTLSDPDGPFQAEVLSRWMEEKFNLLDGPAAAEGRS